LKRDKYVYVDWNYLKESYNNGRLKGAHVFARLFDIVDDELFANNEKNEYNLTYYDIYLEDWVLFFSFVRNGYLPYYNDYSKNLEELNYCSDVCIKLGGVPEFEHYYNDVFNNSDRGDGIYNPMTPYDDVRGSFSWRIVTSYTALKLHETVTSCVSIEPITIFYSRTPIESCTKPT